ncbi:MAG TPA: beta-phosphoglucomutase [Cyclobacteriaceae bacterium]
MIKAVIFDLDGVIVDTAHYHFIAWKRLADELGVPFTEHDNERLKGVSRMQSMDIILELGALQISTERKTQLADKKNTWFVEFVEKMKPSEIFPGVKQLLEELKSQGIKIALASSSKNARRVIELLQIENEFDAVVDGTMIAHTKPDPEIFLLAACMINIPPMQCVVFEDAEAGVEAALAAGMKCVGVGSVAQLGKANRVVKKTADFKSAELQQL